MPLPITPSLIQNLMDLTDAAGRRILQVYASNDFATQVKSDQSPVTAADLLAHETIRDGLARLTPDITLVSEEDSQGPERPLRGTFWLVDPLDGTKEFIARNGEFTVNIALIDAGFPVFGIVAAPALGLLYGGGSGLGAFLRKDGRQEAIQVSTVKAGQALRVAGSRSHRNPETDALLSQLPRHEFISVGSSLKFCQVAEGRIDLYPRLGPTSEWDTAAGQAVLEGAGGVVLELSGQRLGYGKENVLNPHFIAASLPLAAMVRAADCAAKP